SLSVRFIGPMLITALPNAMQSPTEPGTRQCRERQGDRIPDRPQVHVQPRDDTADAQHEPYRRPDPYVRHGGIGRQPRGDVAPRDAVDAPIGQREEIVIDIVHRLVPGWEDPEHVHHLVRAEREKYDSEEPGDERECAPKGPAGPRAIFSVEVIDGRR